MDNVRTMVLWLVGSMSAFAAVCEIRPVPAQLPTAIRRVVDGEVRGGTVKPAAAKPIGLRLPEVLQLSGIDAPVHPAFALLFEERPLGLESAVHGSRRNTARDAAARIAQHVDEWEHEAGPLAASVRAWRKLDAEAQIARIARDVERLVPDLGWWSMPDIYFEISAQVEISPLRLEPLRRVSIWTSERTVPSAVVVREKDSGDFKEWFGVRVAAGVVLLRRLVVEEHSRIDLYAVCR